MAFRTQLVKSLQEATITINHPDSTDTLRIILWRLCEFLFVTELGLLNRSLFNSCHSYQDNGIFSSSCFAPAGGGCGLSLHEEAEQRCNIDIHVLSDVVIMREGNRPRSRDRIP